jgi:hypothetical protein
VQLGGRSAGHYDVCQYICHCYSISIAQLFSSVHPTCRYVQKKVRISCTLSTKASVLAHSYHCTTEFYQSSDIFNLLT